MVSRVRLALRRAALPLGCYYTVTLLLPLANGAGQQGGAFVSHAAVVISVPLLLVFLLGALGALRPQASCVTNSRPESEVLAEPSLGSAEAEPYYR